MKSLDAIVCECSLDGGHSIPSKRSASVIKVVSYKNLCDRAPRIACTCTNERRPVDQQAHSRDSRVLRDVDAKAYRPLGGVLHSSERRIPLAIKLDS